MRKFQRLRLRLGARRQLAANYGTPRTRPVAWTRFVFFDRETTNYTYDIANEQEIVEWAARVTGRPVTEIAKYATEVRRDDELGNAMGALMRPRGDRNNRPRFGRRIGWYLLLRAYKPKLVVETGTHDGLGTALLARGMQHNAADGFAGRFVSFDIEPSAGWVIPEFLRDAVELVKGDSAVTLPRFLEGRLVDFFVHDSDHTAEHERMELTLAVRHAASRLVLISDNAHGSTELRDLAGRMDAPYSFVLEQPRGHLYPGAGIGLAIINDD